MRQVVARFSQPMVSFGDPRSEPPFDMECAGKGRGRWADARNLKKLLEGVSLEDDSDSPPSGSPPDDDDDESG